MVSTAMLFAAALPRVNEVNTRAHVLMGGCMSRWVHGCMEIQGNISSVC